jgi:CRP-like cAMP-binding protein
MRWVYFPETCMISVVSTLGNGACIEVGVIGRRGMAALPVFLDSEYNLMEAFIQVPGRAARVPAEVFLSTSAPGTALYARGLRYTSYFLQQMARSAACNALHRLEQRCARWLLLAADELGRADFSLTHEYLSEMLGVGRASISDLAAEFSDRNLVKYSRGRVHIIDSDGLARTACECYRLITREAENVFVSKDGAGSDRPARKSRDRGKEARSARRRMRPDASSRRRPPREVSLSVSAAGGSRTGSR